MGYGYFLDDDVDAGGGRDAIEDGEDRRGRAERDGLGHGHAPWLRLPHRNARFEARKTGGQMFKTRNQAGRTSSRIAPSAHTSSRTAWAAPGDVQGMTKPHCRGGSTVG